MDRGYFTAFAALAGATLGGLASFISSWMTTNREMREQRTASSVSKRETLYKKYIEEAARAYVDALVHDKLDLAGLVSLYAVISEMRVVSSRQVIESADRVAKIVTETYRQPNKTNNELETMIEDNSIDLLKEFSDTCRQEFEGSLSK